MASLCQIPFYDQNIIAINNNNEIFISLKRICFNLDIDYNAQKQRIDRDPVLSKGVCIIQTPTKGGLQDVVCIPLKLINGFLFGITSSKIKDTNTQNRIIQYQEKCYDVLYEYFNKQQTPQPQLPANYLEALKALVVSEEQKQALELSNQQKETVIQEYIAIDDNKNFTETAKILHLRPNKFIALLRNYKYINKDNIPYQDFINRGYFTVKKTIKDVSGKTKHFQSCLITPNGFNYFSKQVEIGAFDSVKVK